MFIPEQGRACVAARSCCGFLSLPLESSDLCSVIISKGITLNTHTHVHTHIYRHTRLQTYTHTPTHTRKHTHTQPTGITSKTINKLAHIARFKFTIRNKSIGSSLPPPSPPPACESCAPSLQPAVCVWLLNQVAACQPCHQSALPWHHTSRTSPPTTV